MLRGVLRLLMTTGLVAAADGSAAAGSYIAVDNTGQPYKWQGPIEMRFDIGPLGRLSNEEADAFVLSAMDTWMHPQIPGSPVVFVQGEDLEEDQGDGVGPDIYWETGPPYDGVSVVLYDQFGLLIESLGAGMSDSVVGGTDIVYPEDGSPAPLTEALLVMNGKMISEAEGSPGTLPIEQYRGAIIHELGHVLNLGHAQAAVAFTDTGYDVGNPFGNIFGQPPRIEPDYRGMPTMFPTVLPELQTLEMNDVAWVYDLYGSSSPGEVFGTISGVVRDPAGLPFNGANLVAYSVDDPTSMVTAVSGFTDGNPINAPTGYFRIGGLPVGTRWVVDVEPIVDAFTGGSRLGPIDPPPALPGMPEFANEPGVETDSDEPSLSTTFVISNTVDGLHHNADVRFNDSALIDYVEEIDYGFDEHTAQIVPVIPGRMTLIQGTIHPDEPDAQDLGILGLYADVYRVKNPAGLELNQIAMFSEGSPLEVLVLDLKENADAPYISSTASGLGFSAISLYLDSSRVGEGVHNGTYGFAVGYTHPFIGGASPYAVTNYTLLLAFSVSDRDALALGGTDSGQIDPEGGTVRVRGRGFKNVGGVPVVTFDDPGIEVTQVTYIDENNLDVDVSKGPGFVPGDVMMQVMNHADSGGYGGRIRQTAIGEASAVIGWELY